MCEVALVAIRHSVEHEPRHRLCEVQELDLYILHILYELYRWGSVINSVRFVSYTIMQRDLHELHELLRR